MGTNIVVIEFCLAFKQNYLNAKETEKDLSELAPWEMHLKITLSISI